jgi:hypothetical protein
MRYDDDVLLDKILNPFHREGQGWYDDEDTYLRRIGNKHESRIDKQIHRNADGHKSIYTRHREV